MNTENLLVRTPRQHLLESPARFLLRVSEENGYLTPSSLIAFMGADRDEAFTVRLNVSKLAAVLGVPTKHLHGYEIPASAPALGSAFVNGICGMQVKHRDLAVSRSAVCPECVSELGYAPAWFDLAAVDGCPTHQRKLIFACPACYRTLGNLRPGLLRCRCNQELIGARGELIEPDHVALLGWVVSKFVPAMNRERRSEPSEWLESMSLGRLLGVITSFSRLHAAATDRGDATSMQRAARILDQWPNNFHAAMEVLRSSEDAGVTSATRSFGKIVRTRLVKCIPSVSDIAYLRAVMAKTTLRRPDLGVECLIFAAPAKPVQADLVTLAPARRESQRWTADRRVSRSAGQGLEARAAARQLGLPVSVLRFLQRTGVVGSAVRGSVASSDIVHLMREVEELPQRAPLDDAQPMKLSDLLRRRFGYLDAKGELIAGVLSGAIPVIGRKALGFAGLVIDANDAGPFVERARKAGYGGTFSSGAAASQIGCAPDAVADLCSRNYLHGLVHGTGLRIAERSVARFVSEFKFLAILARENDSNVRALLRLASSNGVEVISAKLSCTGKQQPFARVVDCDILTNVLTNSRRLCNGGLVGKPIRSTVKFQDAARAIRCTPTVVSKLVDLGYLSARGSSTARRVVENSLNEFLARFRAVVEVAQLHSVGSIKILNEARARGFEILAVPRGREQPMQYFLRFCDASQLSGPYETKVAARLRKREAALA